MQKPIPVALILLAILCPASRVSAETPNEHLVGFEPFVGRWILQATAKEDAGTVPKGAKVIAYNEFNWTPEKQAIIFNWIFKVDGQESSIHANHLIVWDKQSERITCFWQRSDGEQGTTNWSFEDGMLVGTVDYGGPQV